MLSSICHLFCGIIFFLLIGSAGHQQQQRLRACSQLLYYVTKGAQTKSLDECTLESFWGCRTIQPIEASVFLWPNIICIPAKSNCMNYKTKQQQHIYCNIWQRHAYRDLLLPRFLDVPSFLGCSELVTSSSSGCLWSSSEFVLIFRLLTGNNRQFK